MINMYFKECQPESTKMKDGFSVIIIIAPCIWFTESKLAYLIKAKGIKQSATTVFNK